MSLLSRVLSVGMAALGLVVLLRGRPLVRWPRSRPPAPPGLIRASGLCLLLAAASIVASAELHARALAIVLALAALGVGLIPLIVASRQGRI